MAISAWRMLASTRCRCGARRARAPHSGAETLQCRGVGDLRKYTSLFAFVGRALRGQRYAPDPTTLTARRVGGADGSLGRQAGSRGDFGGPAVV